VTYALSSVTLYVEDIPTSRRFYTEKLGIPVNEDQSNDYFVMLQVKGDALFMLQSAGTAMDGFNTRSGGTEIGFEVDDVDRTYAEWKSRGVQTLTEPHDQPFGRTFNASDPDGHLLNVYRLKGQ
jgi:catechol 2,3-dioxygenase-like lactoylglutathione lyase family enzyme